MFAVSLGEGDVHSIEGPPIGLAQSHFEVCTTQLESLTDKTGCVHNFSPYERLNLLMRARERLKISSKPIAQWRRFENRSKRSKTSTSWKVVYMKPEWQEQHTSVVILSSHVPCVKKSLDKLFHVFCGIQHYSTIKSFNVDWTSPDVQSFSLWWRSSLYLSFSLMSHASTNPAWNCFYVFCGI